jgi:hypothetical protein
MKNTIYTIQCDLFPKNKIIEILKHNNFFFFPVGPKPEEGFGKFITFSEDKMWFIKKVIILNYGDDQIIVGNTYREDMNPSAFQIYFPNQVKTTGFNFNPEFSKALIALDHFNSPGPILSITLNKKNIDKLIKEDDIIFENTMDTSRGFKPLNFQTAKSNSIEKLFLFKHEDLFIVIGWISKGKKNRNKVIYNKAFINFLMEIKPIDLKTPEVLDKKRNYKKGNLAKGKTYIKYDDFESKYNPESNLNEKTHISGFEDKNKRWTDHTPNIEKINIILEKINKSGIDSLSIEELTILNNISG